MEKISSRNIASVQTKKSSKKLTQKHSICRMTLETCFVNYITSAVSVHSYVLHCFCFGILLLSNSPGLLALGCSGWRPREITPLSWVSQSSRRNRCSRESSTWIPSIASDSTWLFFPKPEKGIEIQTAWMKGKKAICSRQEPAYVFVVFSLMSQKCPWT